MNKSKAYGPLSHERASELLKHISPDCSRDTWFSIAAALHNELGDSGFSLFDEWSRGAPSLYDEHKTDVLWKSLANSKTGKRYTAGTLYHHAKPGGWKSSGYRVAGEYVYADVDGPHHRSQRLIKIDDQGRDVIDKHGKPRKDFPISHWEKGQWVSGGGDISRVLYNVQVLRTALLKGDPVFWAEGEKKVDTLLALGLGATTSLGGSGGAGSLKEHNYGKEFKQGDFVVILPDNDEAGTKYMNAVGKMLTAAGVTTCVLQIPDLKPTECAIDWLNDGRGTVEELLRQVEETAEEWVPPALEDDDAPEAEGDLPVVRLSAENFNKNIFEIQDLLLDTGLYQNGSLVVRPGHAMVVDYLGVVHQVPQNILLDAHAFILHAHKHIKFEKWSISANAWVPTKLTIDHATTLLGLKDQLKFPLLRATIATPVVLTTGRVLQIEGYDAETKLFLDFNGTKYPPITTCTQEEAVIKLRDFANTLLCSYPFKLQQGETPDRNLALAVALSLNMTLINRVAYPKTPGHCVNGNRARVGKGKLVSTAAMLATGSTAVVMGPQQTADEFEKTLKAALIEGSIHIAIDNVVRTLEGELFDQMMTEDWLKIRQFGVLRNIKVANVAAVTVTGNKVSFRSDSVYRWLQCDIESHEERPDLVQHAFDPPEVALRERGRLVSLLLSVVKGYADAKARNETTPPKRQGSFEVWSDNVRGSLIWAGQPDVADAIEIVIKSDTKVTAREDLLEIWWEVFGSREVTLAEVVDEAGKYQSPTEPDYRPLDAALWGLVSGDVKDFKKAVGTALSASVADIVINGKMLIKHRPKNKSIVTKWQVVEIQQQGEIF
jgi:hypothetical protein